jgi:trehalose 6-phosphate phosphatase
MIHLLSEEGRHALRAIATRPILYAFDFDGTLAPISPRRETVQIPRSVNEWLKELAKRVPCAVISGRGLADLVPRVNGAVPHVIGNHGIESPLTPPPVLHHAERTCREWARDLTTRFGETLEDLGIEVENKRYSLTLHFRGAAEPSRARLALLLLLQQLTPAPHTVAGKASVNVLPTSETGKGQAALALMAHLRQAGLFFVGDDETDETVFRLTEGLTLGVRVGRQPESRARFYLKHQSEIEEVLRFLVHRLDRTPEPGSHSRLGRTEKREAINDR